MAHPTDPNIGLVLDGRYEITGFIAQGGMGRVYAAVQRTLERTVAVKLLRQDLDHGAAGADDTEAAEDFQRRFFLEASLCARLSHPNTVRVFDYGCHEGHTLYIVMEHLQGRSVRALIADDAPLTQAHALSIITQVLGALIEAHDAGLVHRDLKPSNLFLTPDGVGGERVKILDFGVVKQVNVDAEVTQSQSVLGSPQYMSPEQAQGAEVDGRSDLYSLGAILFHLLSGQPPFQGRDPITVAMKHIIDPIPALGETNPGVVIDAEVEDIVRRALQKAPSDRFANAREMRARMIEVAAALGGESPAGLVPSATVTNSLYETETLAMPAQEAEAEPETTGGEPLEDTLEQLEGFQLSGLEAYVDLNCPYCYALFERVFRWGLADQIEWRMIEHAGHVLNGPFDLEQEEMLSNEVFEVHHRAPDIELSLPPRRCQSTRATFLLALVHDLFPETVNAFRRGVYQALWRSGLNISAPAVLVDLLTAHDLPRELIDMTHEPPDRFTADQRAWEQGEYDHCIPVLTDTQQGRVLVGLADQRSLAAFLLGQRQRIIDKTVCFYEPKPTLLVCGWMNHLGALLSEVKSQVELIQAPTARRAAQMLSERAVPALLVIEDGHMTADEERALCQQARIRSVPWIIAAQHPDAAREIDTLSKGAIEYLSVAGDAKVSRARLMRILSDRFRLSTQGRRDPTDPLTRLPTRRVLLERLEDAWGAARGHGEPISLVLLNLIGFKGYNKAHGYLSGDAVLRLLAQGFQRLATGRGQLAARFSGNEFALLLPGVDATEAAQTAEQMRLVVAAASIENRADADQGQLLARTGVCSVVPGEHSSLYTLIDGAHSTLNTHDEQGT